MEGVQITEVMAGVMAWDEYRLHWGEFVRKREGSGESGRKDVGCFRLSEGFSQAIREGSPRLILLLFGGIPNSPWILKIVRI